VEYQKIPSPFMRNTEKGPDRNKLIIGQWTSPELEYLATADWVWTEKVDGTNIRILWDGHKVSYGGRTDNAQIPAKLLPALDRLFPEEILETVFGNEPVLLYGEGYGAGILAGGNYRQDQSFVLFDVRIHGWWLRRANVEEIGKSLGVDIVPVVHTGSIWWAVEMMRHGFRTAWNPEVEAEGLVGTTPVGLLGRDGERLIVKVKRKDFRES
jgi:RNA ligase-like protein